MTDTNDSKATKEAIRTLKNEFFESRMALKQEWKEKIASLPAEEQKAAKKMASDAYLQSIHDEEAAVRSLKMKDVTLSPEERAKLEKKAAKKELADKELAALKDRWAEEKLDKEAFKIALAGMSPREQMLAKEARKETSMEAFREREREKNAPKLAEKLKDPKFAAKHAKKEAIRLADEERKRVAYEKAGALISSGAFHTKKFRFFENGYVAVDGWALKGLPEKLIDVTSSVDVQKKTGFGRAAGAVITAGVNLAGPNLRGDIYLYVITEETTHTIHLDPPSPFEVNNARKVEALGKACLAMAESKNQQPATATVTSADISEPLAKLVEFHKSGALTDDEFALAKAKLLAQ